MNDLPEHEGGLAEIKEEAATHGQAIVFAAIRALYVFVIEWIAHALLHGLENHVMHEKLPGYVYRMVEYAGIGSLLVYIGAGLWKHCLETFVDTSLESRRALQRLAGTPRNIARPVDRNNEQVQNVTQSDNNENTHENSS